MKLFFWFLKKLNETIVNMIYDSCVSDMCNSQYTESQKSKYKCENFRQLGNLCYSNGLFDFNWRDASGCCKFYKSINTNSPNSVSISSLNKKIKLIEKFMNVAIVKYWK